MRAFGDFLTLVQKNSFCNNVSKGGDFWSLSFMYMENYLSFELTENLALTSHTYYIKTYLQINCIGQVE